MSGIRQKKVQSKITNNSIKIFAPAKVAFMIQNTNPKEIFSKIG